MNDLEVRVTEMLRHRADSVQPTFDLDSVVAASLAPPSRRRHRFLPVVVLVGTAAAVAAMLVALPGRSAAPPPGEAPTPTSDVPPATVRAEPPTFTPTQGQLSDEAFTRILGQMWLVMEADGALYSMIQDEGGRPLASLLPDPPEPGALPSGSAGRGGGSYFAWRGSARGYAVRDTGQVVAADLLVQSTNHVDLRLVDTFGERFTHADNFMSDGPWQAVPGLVDATFADGRFVVLRGGGAPALVVDPGTPFERVVELGLPGVCAVAAAQDHLAVLVGTRAGRDCVGDTVVLVDGTGAVRRTVTLPVEVRSLDGTSRGIFVAVGTGGQLVGGELSLTTDRWTVMVDGDVVAARLPDY